MSVIPRTRQPTVGRFVAGIIMIIAAGCGQGATTSGSPSPRPSPSSLADFEKGFCDGMQAMFRAVGNPDTGNDSELSFQLDRAIERGDVPSANQLAAQMRAELRLGREHAAYARGWPDGTEIAANLDRVLMAFDASVEAKRAAAAQGLEASETAAQAAFQNLGAGEAWIAMLDGYRNLVLADPARKPLDCELPADPRNPGG